MTETPGIGLLNERPLHAALKMWYSRPGDRFEVPVDGYVIDIVRGDQLLEIQTGNFASIRPKLEKLSRRHRVRLIHPIAREKWILRTAKKDGRRLGRRKSPKRGRIEDLFWEMVYTPRLLASRNFSMEVLMIREEEVRRLEGRRTWRSKGWVVEERRLLEVADRRLFEDPASWLALLPHGAGPFTSRDLAEALQIDLELAQKMTYSLRNGGLVRSLGTRGRANLYQATGRPT